MDSKNSETAYKELLAKRVRSSSYTLGDEASKKELKSRVFQKYQELLEKKEDTRFAVHPRAHKITPLDSNALFTREFLSFEFRGRAFEYFKIWIVNIFLTLLTLGIYSAWAKVRSNRYLYANTFLNGANFEYNADPRRILYGRAIVVGFYLLFILLSDVFYLKELAAALFVLFILLLPWLIAKAVAFKYKSTSYRNIRFSYQGRVRSFYYLGFLFLLPFLLIMLLSIAAPNLARFFPEVNLYLDALPVGIVVIMILSIFIYYPLLYREYKRVVINYGYYGKQAFFFDAKAWEIIVIFFKIMLVMLFFLFFISFTTLFLTKNFAIDLKSIDLHNGVHFIAIYAVVMSIYLLIISFFKGLSDGYLSNFVRNNTRLGDGEFQGSINPFRLAFISSSNTLLLIVSLGLLYPYTKLRYLEYKIENTLFACDDYDKFLASRNESLSTLGEESVDFFDIDVGI